VRLALLVPETFMNESGRSIAKAARFHKLDREQILVVYDEVELAFGRVKAPAGGGLKGHNGLRSPPRRSAAPSARCGVGRPERGDRRPPADCLLSPFEPHEDPEPLVERGADCAGTVARSRGARGSQQRFDLPRRGTTSDARPAVSGCPPS